MAYKCVGNEKEYVPKKMLFVKKSGNSCHALIPKGFEGRRIERVIFYDE